jgi:hypothetical protein
MNTSENAPVALARAFFERARAVADQFPRIAPLLRANGHLLSLQETPACHANDQFAALIAGARHRKGLRQYVEGRGWPS